MIVQAKLAKGRYTIYQNGEVQGWADAVVFGQPNSPGTDRAATVEVVPVEWTYHPGGIGATGYAVWFYGYVSKDGRERPHLTLTPRAGFTHDCTPADMIADGWSQVLPGQDGDGIWRGWGFLTTDIGCWARPAGAMSQPSGTI